MGPSRGAESWWICSDSDSDIDSGLLIDPDSDSDSGSGSGSDAKYRINNTLIVERVPTVQAEKNVTFAIDFPVHSLGRKVFIPVITHA